MMWSSVLLIFVVCFYTMTNACQTKSSNDDKYNFTIVSRNEWNAREPKLVEKFNGQIPFVIIHHSFIPKACHTNDTCIEAVRSIQDFHQNQRGWNDIGYSFLVGGDERIYTGRGYNTIGAHAPRYNTNSIGICLIGDWSTILPPQKMLKTVKAFLDYSIQEGYLREDYKLLGHRQVRNTECPGDKLFEEISSWHHFSIRPSGPEDHEIPSF